MRKHAVFVTREPVIVVEPGYDCANALANGVQFLHGRRRSYSVHHRCSKLSLGAGAASRLRRVHPPGNTKRPALRRARTAANALTCGSVGQTPDHQRDASASAHFLVALIQPDMKEGDDPPLRSRLTFAQCDDLGFGA